MRLLTCTAKGRAVVASVFVVSVLVMGTVSAPSGGAATTETLLVSEPFSHSSLAPGAPFLKLDGACLTADAKTSDSPVPGCTNPASDTNGSGVLRLTPAVNGAKGGLIYNSTLPTADGLDVQFTQYQYGGGGADGIGFVIAAAPPMPSSVGVAGGALGYVNLSGGYLGIGFDSFGNYLNPLTSGTGCVQPAWVPNNPPWNSGNAISVRGPGTPGPGEGRGYCILTGNFDPHYGIGGVLPGSLRGTSRANAARRVHIVLDAKALTYSVSVDFTGTGNSYTPIIRSAPLPKPIPPRITFGFSASTGAVNDIHAIANLQVSTFNSRAGYWLAGSDGGVFAFATKFSGSKGGQALPSKIAGIGATPGSGYWLAARDGSVYSFGDARFHGSMMGVHLNKAIIGIAATPTGGGYWLVASDGGIFAFGDARFYGSMGGVSLNAPITGVAATPTGGGYWLVASDGGVFAFGDAHFYGSMGATHLTQPAVAIASTPTAHGYWLAGADGGVFTFGDAHPYGSLGGVKGLAGPVVGIAASPTGFGYWLASADGGIFNYGDAAFYGSLSGQHVLTGLIVGIARG